MTCPFCGHRFSSERLLYDHWPEEPGRPRCLTAIEMSARGWWDDAQGWRDDQFLFQESEPLEVRRVHRPL